MGNGIRGAYGCRVNPFSARKVCGDNEFYRILFRLSKSKAVNSVGG